MSSARLESRRVVRARAQAIEEVVFRTREEPGVLLT